MDKSKRIKLLEKYDQGRASAEEIRALEDYADQLMVGDNLGVFASELEKQQIKKELLTRIEVEASKTSVGWLRIAAGIAALIGLSAALWFSQNQLFGPEMMVAQTGVGEHKTILMTDGSIVVLNSKSTIEYPKTFAVNSREVKLEGEALFTIEKDALRPFTVSTNQLNTTVLGTVFNVSAYIEDSLFQVSLLEGSVRVDQDQNQMLLKPNEQSTFDLRNADLLKSTFDPANVMAWQENKLVLSKTSFARIKTIAARKYGVELQFGHPEIATYTVSGTFQDPDLKTLLATICAAKSLHYKPTGERQILISKP